MTSPYQAYGQNPPSLSYSNPVTSNNFPGYPPQSQYKPAGLGYNDPYASNRPISGPDDRPKPIRENSTESKDGDTVVLIRDVSRTPSPTPSEVAELNKASLFDFKAMMHWRYWIRREWLWYYVIAVISLVFVVLFTVFHSQIVHALQPAANWMHDLPAGWLIPIVIFFIISFPPLFGHEILAIVCGLVWGLWPGFGIVCAGTFVGELGNFYAFRYCCSARGEKLEHTKLQYAYLARVVRDGGFRIALIARFSAIPGHFTTAVFSTCGMGIWTFSLAALLSLPKQFVTVYLGVALEQSENGGTSTSDKIIKAVVIILTTVVTIGAMWYVYKKMNEVKPQVIYERRKRRQAKLPLANTSTPYLSGSTLEVNNVSSEVFNPNLSSTTLPTRPTSPRAQHQQWDAQGRAVGYAPDPSLYAPQPKRPTRLPSPPSSRGGSRSGTPRGGEPVMSEAYGPGPVRRGTAGSTGSAPWSAPAPQGQESYQMSNRPPSTKPQAQVRVQSPVRSPPPSSIAKLPPPPSSSTSASFSISQYPQQQQSYQQYPQQQQTPTYAQTAHPPSAPPPYVSTVSTTTPTYQLSHIQPYSPISPISPHVQSPLSPLASPGSPSLQQVTPTQARFSPPNTHTQSNTNASMHPQFPEAQPYALGHIPETSESSYYTAPVGHSRPGTEDTYSHTGYGGLR